MYIVSSVTSIGASAFSGCNNIVTVTIPTLAIKSIPKTKLQSVVITSGTCIEFHTFMNCDSLESITLSYGATNIELQTFMNCKNLMGITISECVTNIGDSAFAGCSGLTSITIPDRESISDLHPTSSYIES